MKILTILTIGTLIAASLSGCKKEIEGPPGKQGPAGSSNVTVRDISINPGNWNTYDTYNLYFNTSVAIPTTDACMVYVSFDNVAYTPIPSMFYQNGDLLTFQYHSQYNLRLTYYNPNGVSGIMNQTLYFKIINIPPSGLIKNPDLDLNNYESVKELFNFN